MAFQLRDHIKRLISRSLSLVLFDGEVAVDGNRIYTAEALKVGLFQSVDSF